MDISFNSSKLCARMNDLNSLKRYYGDNRAGKIMERLQVLAAADSLYEFEPDLKPERCHELKGERKGQFSMDLNHPLRLIFKPDHDIESIMKNGVIDWRSITRIVILEVVDPH